MWTSIWRIEGKHTDKLVKATYRPAKNSWEAFIKEHQLMMELGGPKSFSLSSMTYNLIYSPGRKLGLFK